MFTFLRLHLVFMLVATTMAEFPANTSVTVMLGMIPKCSVTCVMNDVFLYGGCEMSDAGALSTCACTNVTLQSHLSACVQKSCSFEDQLGITAFATGLCDAYPKESRVNELKTASIVTIVLGILFLFMRLYSRWLKTDRWWSDDAYATVAAILLIVVAIIILRMSLAGFGLHYWDIPAENAVDLLKLFYVCQMLYIGVQVFSKVAILALYARLIPDCVRWFHWTVLGMTIFMFTHGLVFFFLVVFQCWPIESIWNKTVEGKCLPVNVAIGFTGAGLSIAEDFILLFLPIRELWKLQMSTRKKVGICLLLSVGSFASITSIVRLRYVLKYANTYDATWDNVDVIKWSLIEILSACICGNLLPLRPLVDQLLPRLRTVMNWYTDRSRSRRTSEKPSNEGSGRSGGWLNRSNKSSEKPELIPTLNLTRASLNPGWDWRKTQHTNHFGPNVNPDAITPSPPVTPEQLEKGLIAHERYFEEPGTRHPYPPHVPHGLAKKTSSTRMNVSQTTNTDSDWRISREGSERDLVPPRRHDNNRISGPWSYALTLFDRR